MSIVGKDVFPNLLALQRADALGQNPACHGERLPALDVAMALYEEICRDADALTVSDLAIGGADLIALGFKGKEIGEKLSLALNIVLDDPTQNQKEILLKKIKNCD